MFDRIKHYRVKKMERIPFAKRIVAVELAGIFVEIWYFTHRSELRSLILYHGASSLMTFLGVAIVVAGFALRLLEFNYVLRRAKAIGIPMWVAIVGTCAWRYSNVVKFVSLVALAIIPSEQVTFNGSDLVHASCPNFVPIDSQPQEQPSDVPQENKNAGIIRKLKRRVLLFFYFNVVGATIILFGLFFKSTPSLILGIVLSAIGINFSILALPSLIALGASIIIAIFVTPHLFPIAIVVALVAAWTAYCLGTEYTQLKRGILPF